MVRNQIDDLLSCIGDTCLLHRCRVITKTIYDRLEACRKVGAGHAADALNLTYVCHRHDACDNRNRDSFFSDTVQVIIKDIIIKEHLGRHKITARFHFFFQMPDIHRLVDRFHMSLRIAGCADAQIRAGLTDLADQLGCILIIFFYLAVFRNIAAKCQDILNSVCLNLAQDTVHLLTGRGDAGQM